MSRKAKALDGVRIPPGANLARNGFIQDYPEFIELLVAICKGRYPGGIVSGPRGCGKTFAIRQLEKRFSHTHTVVDPDTGESSEQPAIKFHWLSPETTTFWNSIMENNRSNDVIIVEDRGSLLQEEVTFSYLLRMLDRRTKQRTVEVPYRGKQVTDAKIIFVTPQNLFSYDFKPASALGAQVGELRRIARESSFSFPFDDLQLYHYACYKKIASKFFRRLGLQVDQTNEVLRFFGENYPFLIDVDFTMLEDLATARRRLKGYKSRWARSCGNDEEERKRAKRLEIYPGVWEVGHTRRMERGAKAAQQLEQDRLTYRASRPEYPLLLVPEGTEAGEPKAEGTADKPRPAKKRGRPVGWRKPK